MVTMSLSRDFKGIWIPKEIWLLSNLSKMSVLLWAEIHSLYSANRGGCYASNEYLCEFLGVQERQLQRYLCELKKAGLLVQESFDGRSRILKAIVPQQKFEHAEEQCDVGSEVSHKSGGGVKKCGPEVSHMTPLSYIERKEEKKDKKNIAQTRKIESEQRTDFSFSSESGVFEGIYEKDVEDWSQAYEHIDVHKEIIKAQEWVKANPSKAKKKLWRKFLIGWFARANDKAENQAAYRSNSQESKSNKRKNSRLSFAGEGDGDEWKPNSIKV